jgi:periplasmic protein TonB
VTNGIRLPFALSLIGHAVLLGLLALFVTRPPPLPLAQPTSGIVVTLAPNLPQAEAPPAPAWPMQPPSPSLLPAPPAPEPPPVAAVEPPSPAPPLPERPAVAAVEPPPARTVEPPIVEPEPPRKLALRPLRPERPVLREPERKLVMRPFRPVLRHPERPEQTEPSPPVPLSPTAQAAYPRIPAPAPQSGPPAQTANAKMPAPAAAVSEVSAGYRALLSAWLESHKRYPKQARESAEQGEAVLRFTVDRNGRIPRFAVIRSSGYPDLDAAVENMMRGASLPPFPADMPESSITVSVGIRFSLES